MLGPEHPTTGQHPSKHSSDEAGAFRWASGTEISDLTDEAYAIRIRDALSQHPTAIRHHDGKRLLDRRPGAA